MCIYCAGTLLVTSGKMNKMVDKDSETTRPLDLQFLSHITKAFLNMCRRSTFLDSGLPVESATSLQSAFLIIQAKSGSKNKIVTTIKPGNIPPRSTAPWYLLMPKSFSHGFSAFYANGIKHHWREVILERSIQINWSSIGSD